MIEFESRCRYDSFWEVLKSEAMKLFKILIGQYELSDIGRLELWDSRLNIYNSRLPGSGGDDFDLTFIFIIKGGDDMIEFRFCGFSDTNIPEDWDLSVTVILRFTSVKRRGRIKKNEKHLDLHDVMNSYDGLYKVVNDLYNK